MAAGAYVALFGVHSDGAQKTEETANVRDPLRRVVEIRVGEYRYHIPLNYINPRGNFKGQRWEYPNRAKEEKNRGYRTFPTAGFKTFLPDYRGYDQDNFRDPFHPDKITVNWLADDAGAGETETRLRNLTTANLIEPIPSLSLHGLKGYKGAGAYIDRVIWIGVGSHGEKMFIQCVTKVPKPLCQVRYHQKVNRYWLAYTYTDSHLANWRAIDDNVNCLLMTWRVGRLTN